MILVILAICITSIITGAIMIYSFSYNLEGAGVTFISVGGATFMIALIACISLTYDVSMLSVIDERIEMYQEENAEIEEDIAVTVANYQEYESGVITSVAPDSIVTLVSLYPELKADTMVQKQIEIYIENSNKIKELREDKISGSVLRWWLYFGG